MKIYEIDAQIEEILASAVDENGEVDPDAMAQLEALQMERDSKTENLACVVKNHRATAEAIKAEIKALTQRAKDEEAQADRAAEYLRFILKGERISTGKVFVSYRTTQSVEISDDFWFGAKDEFLRYADPEPNKAAIKAAIKAGEVVPGACLISKTSMIVK